MENDKIILEKFYRDIKEYKNLIIDVRGNGGGNTNYPYNLIIEPLLGEAKCADIYALINLNRYNKKFLKSDYLNELVIPKEEILEKFNVDDEIYENATDGIHLEFNIKALRNKDFFNGKIYILCDKGCYSATDFFINIAKQIKFATIVGTNTSGDGLQMDPALMVLPNSKYLVRYSLFYGINEDGTPNAIYGTKPDVYSENALEDTLKIIENK